MNQTKKRLSIINLAISITDIDTIQLQILKLGLLKSDQKIQEIITMLQAENYAQAQGLITTYIETPLEEIHQRSTPKELIQTDEDTAIIEEFDLFIEEENIQKEPLQEIDDLHAFIDPIEEPTKISTEQINYDTLLNVDANDILPDNIELDISNTAKDTFFDTSTNKSLTRNMPKDIFFDNIQNNTENKIEKVPEEKINTSQAKETITKETIQHSTDTENLLSEYNAISYIDQKFKNLYTQYPPIETSEEDFPSVKAWIDKISQKGYSEVEVEEIIQHVEKLIPKNKAEAAELLLLTASTKSKYAQFQLARALYKGEIFLKNIPESFTLISSLAINDDYPEALCDLGQFYEYGIGTERDLLKARLLYQEAMKLNIERAKNHYKRLLNQKKSFFSFLKR